MLYQSAVDADVPQLSSRRSAVLKRVRAVRAGREKGLLLLEGERLIRDAVGAGVALELLLVADDLEFPAELHAHSRYRVARSALQEVSALRTTPGYLALGEAPASRSLEELELPADALVLVVDGVSDPGNLGALARSCEAAGGSALVVLPGGARPGGEKALRGSMGSLLRLPVVEAGEVTGVRTTLDQLGFRSVAAATRGGASLDAFDWSGRVALWINAETGEAHVADAGELEPVTIPMAGEVESLNVTVAASLLLFAAGRSRR